MSSLTRLDARSTSLEPDEIIAIACVRDEALRLPSFLQHHRDLGVGRFFVVDNGSTDGTTGDLLAQPDVHVFATEDSYAGSSCGTAWINELGARFGVGHWVLTLDADELFIYPDFERIDLRALVGYLDGRGSQAMASLLLDMYPAGPIASAVHVPGGGLLARCPYFDSDSYFERWPAFQDIPVRGGPRTRLFRYEGGRKGPLLGKVPLARWRSDLAYDGSTHWLPGCARADVTGVLLHFKFLSDLPGRAELEAARGEHWNGATEYRSYARALRDDPNLTLHYPGSVRFRGSRQLLDLGLARSSAAFEDYVDRIAGSAGGESRHNSV